MSDKKGVLGAIASIAMELVGSATGASDPQEYAEKQMSKHEMAQKKEEFRSFGEEKKE